MSSKACIQRSTPQLVETANKSYSQTLCIADIRAVAPAFATGLCNFSYTAIKHGGFNDLGVSLALRLSHSFELT